MKPILLAALFLATGCLPQRVLEAPVIGPQSGEIGRPGRAAAEVTLTQKPVSGREAPVTLIAVDGTRCTVTEKRFRESSIGERVWCDWKRG